SPTEDSRPAEARSPVGKRMSSLLPTVRFVMSHRRIHRTYHLAVRIASMRMEEERQPSISRVRAPYLPISPSMLFPQANYSLSRPIPLDQSGIRLTKDPRSAEWRCNNLTVNSPPVR